MKRGDLVWWAQKHGTEVTDLKLVRHLGGVTWAPGVYVQGVSDGRKYNVGEESLWPLDAVTPPVLHKCCSPSCPGYPYRASDCAHPADTCGPQAVSQ